MLVLVTFGLPLNVLFPKQKGHTMKGEVCITCFNAEALQDQRGPYLPFRTLPRLSRLNFVLHVDAHLQGLQRDRLQSWRHHGHGRQHSHARGVLPSA